MIKSLTSGLFWLFAAGLLAVAAPAAAQSRIAILDGTGVSVLDTTTGQAQARFELQQRQPQEHPFGVTASADGARLFITTSASEILQAPSSEAFLYVLDASTGDQLARISTPWITGKAVVTPDGSRAFLTSRKVGDFFASTTMTIVDLATMTSQVATLPALDNCSCGVAGDAPNGGAYLLCSSYRIGGVILRTATGALALRITPTGLQQDGGFFGGPDPLAVAVSPDGTRVFATWSFRPPHPTIEVHDAVTHALLGSTYVGDGTLPSHVFGIGDITSQTASRAFVQMSTSNPVTHIVLFDTTAGAALGFTTMNATLVTDRTGAMTFALQSNRLSRLDNDTAAPTTIATGPGGWLKAAVLPDPCPTDATASPALFTTTGGSGTLTITAAPSCTWSIDASASPGLTVTTSSGTGSATVPLSLGSVAAPRRGLVRIGARSVAIEQLQPFINIDEPGAIAQQPFIVRGWAIEVSATPSTAAPPPPTVAAVHVWAWPTSGAAPIFIGATNASRPRPDIAAVFGSAYGAAEFSLPVQGLPGGTYTLVAYAQSARTGTFTQEKSVLVTVQPARRDRRAYDKCAAELRRQRLGRDVRHYRTGVERSTCGPIRRRAGPPPLSARPPTARRAPTSRRCMANRSGRRAIHSTRRCRRAPTRWSCSRDPPSPVNSTPPPAPSPCCRAHSRT